MPRAHRHVIECMVGNCGVLFSGLESNLEYHQSTGPRPPQTTLFHACLSFEESGPSRSTDTGAAAEHRHDTNNATVQAVPHCGWNLVKLVNPDLESLEALSQSKLISGRRGTTMRLSRWF